MCLSPGTSQFPPCLSFSSYLSLFHIHSVLSRLSSLSFVAPSVSLFVCRLPNLSISCDIILMWIDFVMPFDVGSENNVCWYENYSKSSCTVHTHTSVKLPFFASLIPRKLYRSHGQSRSSFHWWTLTPTLHRLYGFLYAIWPDVLLLFHEQANKQLSHTASKEYILPH